MHGWSVPHYAISIIRGRGIDEVALSRVLETHPASAIAFVDGWTGKGAITRDIIAAPEGDGQAARTSTTPR